jgi:hypothetical protein
MTVSRLHPLTAPTRTLMNWLRPGLPALLLLGSAGAVRAQDIILKQDKTRIQAKVLEIGDEVVRYKQFDFQDGPTYTIRKAEVFMILYKGGRTETFDAATPSPAPARAAARPAPAAPAPAPAEPAVAAAPPAAASGSSEAMVKNPFRLMAGIGLSDMGDAGEFMGAVEVVGSNTKIGFLSKLTNAGLGASVNSYVDLSHDAEDGERLVYSKHYLSGYAFKEFDGRLGTVGLLAGPSINYTHARYYVYPDYSKPGQDISTGFFTVGVHTSQYVQKYLWKNSQGQKTGFLRLGFNQFLMLQGSLGSSFFLNIGI